MMRHVCDYGVREAPLEGGAFKMRPHRRRKALASLLGFATRTRPQARLGASPKQWLSLARTGNAALRPSADVPKGSELRPQAAANAKTRVCGVARLCPYWRRGGGAARLASIASWAQRITRFIMLEALRRTNC
jgi:hypothetical protein